MAGMDAHLDKNIQHMLDLRADESITSNKIRTHIRSFSDSEMLIKVVRPPSTKANRQYWDGEKTQRGADYWPTM